MNQEIHTWLSAFALDPAISGHIAEVVSKLPVEVRDDLVGDASFALHDYEPGDGTVTCVPVAGPLRGRPGRSVSLKRTLKRRPVGFIHWVIAHEFAHAHLRNRGGTDYEDPETAADRLAAAWGFPKPIDPFR